MEGDGGDWPALVFRGPAARLVIARDFTVLAANANAVALIEFSGVVSLRDGSLATRDRRSDAELLAIVAEAATAPRVGIVGAGGPSALLTDAFALGEEADSPVALLVRDLRTSAEIECADLEVDVRRDPRRAPGDHPAGEGLLQPRDRRAVRQVDPHRPHSREASLWQDRREDARTAVREAAALPLDPVAWSVQWVARPSLAVVSGRQMVISARAIA